MTLPKLAAMDDIFKGLKIDLSDHLKEKDTHLANQYLCIEKLEVIISMQCLFVASVHYRVREWVLVRRDADLSPRSKRLAAAKKKQMGKDADKEREYKIGVLGCGKIGKKVVKYLLATNDFKPSQIMVSTRRPEDCRSLQQRGVEVFYDNEKLARGCNMLFICCRPANINQVAAGIKGEIARQTLVMSVVCGLSAEKLQSLLSIKRCVRPCFDVDSTVKSKSFKAIRKKAKPEEDATFIDNPAMAEFAAESYCRDLESIFNLFLGMESSVTGMDMILEEIRVLCMMAVLGADVDTINFKSTPASELLNKEFPDINFEGLRAGLWETPVEKDEEVEHPERSSKVEDAVVKAFRSSFCEYVSGRNSGMAPKGVTFLARNSSLGDMASVAPSLSNLNIPADVLAKAERVAQDSARSHHDSAQDGSSKGKGASKPK